MDVQERSAELYREYRDQAILSLRGCDNAKVKCLLCGVVGTFFGEPELVGQPAEIPFG